MPLPPEVVTNVLGPAPLPLACAVGGSTFNGWQRAFADEREAVERVDRHWRACHHANIRLFVGAGGDELTVNAVPGMPVPDVAVVAGVGAQVPDKAAPAYPTPNGTSVVRQLLAELLRRVPCEVLYADERNLRAAFLSPATSADAAWLAGQILTVAPDSLDLYPGLVARLNLPVPTRSQVLRFGPSAGDTLEVPGELAAMAVYIQSAHAFRLWWD
jgi:hypothetical protein